MLSINNQNDGDLTNNTASTSTTLDSDYDIITLIINADDYASETSWKLLDEANEIISTGSLESDDSNEVYSEEICVNYTSCFSLYFYDSYGDGICCGFGEGSFQVLDASEIRFLLMTGNLTISYKKCFVLMPLDVRLPQM